MFHTISSIEPKVHKDRVNKRRKWGKKNLQSKFKSNEETEK